MKYLGVNLTKNVNDLYKEKFKPRKKSRKTTEDGKISCAHGLVESYSKNGYTTKSNVHA
jgi:hypothetical protein